MSNPSTDTRHARPNGPVQFCSLWDSKYLTRGLTLIESIHRFIPECPIWVLCMDEDCWRFLSRLCIPGVVPLNLPEVESEALTKAREDRTPTEFMWTCTPIVCEYVLQRIGAGGHVVYVDADVMFFDDPRRLIEELGADSVLVFEHGFPQSNRHLAEQFGRFNVEVIVFTNDHAARACVAWWREHCLEWCYHRVEPGRMGDQKYLDEWPQRFTGIVVAGGAVPALAPWNFETWRVEDDGAGRLSVAGEPLLLVHFSKLTILDRARFELCDGYAIPPVIKRLAYDPYVEALTCAWDRVRRLDTAVELVRPPRLTERAARRYERVATRIRNRCPQEWRQSRIWTWLRASHARVLALLRSA